MPFLANSPTYFDCAEPQLPPSAAANLPPQWGPTTPATAIEFDGCFGWLHQAIGPAVTDTAAVLCAGLGRDASTGHRSFVILAEALAAAGCAALRFDYPGLGDSPDIASLECWAAWARSIHDAADWLREATGARTIVLIGLRLGATLAALTAAARTDVSGLVLLEPVVRGKSYVGQLQMEARLRRNDAAKPEEGVAVDELNLDRATLERMNQVDLRQVLLPPGCAVAVFSQRPSPVLSTCAEAWRNQDAPVAHSDFTGLEAFLRPTHLADEPPADVTPILSWLQANVESRPAAAVATPTVRKTVVLKQPGYTEMPLRFGQNGHLFGMLCRPDGDSDHVVVIGNTGGDPHHGFARFSVEFARRLAAEGIASFRIDFAGLGESFNPPRDRDSPTHVFEVDRSPDIRAAIDRLQDMGYRRFTANGLCSGAYHAFQGALADERIGALLLINLPWFTLRYDKAGPESVARRSMATLSRRQVSTLLLFAKGDAGIKGLEKHFGPSGTELADFPGMAVSIVAGLDHDLTGHAMRRLAAGHMIDFLRQALDPDHRQPEPGKSLGGLAPQPPALAACSEPAPSTLTPSSAS